jgi:hypothetical protein
MGIERLSDISSITKNPFGSKTSGELVLLQLSGLSETYIEGLLTGDSKRTFMQIRIMQVILVLAIFTAFICPIHASCPGSCAVSVGGSSYDFLGDPSFDPSMDTFNDFVSDNLGQVPLSTQSILPEAQPINSSINPVNNGNTILNGIITYNMTDDPRKGIFNITTTRLGGSVTQDKRQSNFASTIFDNNMF